MKVAQEEACDINVVLARKGHNPAQNNVFQIGQTVTRKQIKAADWHRCWCEKDSKLEMFLSKDDKMMVAFHLNDIGIIRKAHDEVSFVAHAGTEAHMFSFLRAKNWALVSVLAASPYSKDRFFTFASHPYPGCVYKCRVFVSANGCNSFRWGERYKHGYGIINGGKCPDCPD